MGIVNLTPDSFSDGGQFSDAEEAVDAALRLVEEGADLLDIGGESTRPYATPVDEAEECRRVSPVIKRLPELTDVPLSIDTSKSTVARLALDAGFEIINDITGLEGDPRMVETAVRHAAGICVMHMRGTPRTMQDDPTYEDPVAEIAEYLRRRQEKLIEAGISPDRICVDPGVGFGKTHQHNLALVADCWRFHRIGAPLLVGHSRKGFIGKLLGDRQADRVLGSVAIGLALATQGVQMIRVHDVRAMREALKCFEAAGGTDGVPGVVDGPRR